MMAFDRSPKPSSRSRIKVLVIDDSELARTQLRRVLTEAGIQVFEQSSGIGATRNILQNEISVAIVDVSMPGISGDKLVRLFRDNPRLTRLAIVVVSARTDAELAELAKTTPADAVMSKQRAMQELVGTVQRLATGRSVREHA